MRKKTEKQEFKPISRRKAEKLAGFKFNEDDFKPISEEQANELASGDSIGDTLREGAADVMKAGISGISGLKSGVTRNLDDRMIGIISAAWQKATGDKRDFGEIYDEVRSKALDEKKLLQSADPMAAFIGEMVGGGLTSPAGAVKNVADAAVYGLGSSESDNPDDMLKQGGTSALISGATQLVTKGAGKILSRRPEATRAAALGSSAKDFQKSGIKEREGMSKRLADIGFFKRGSNRFDPISEKMIKSKTRTKYPKHASKLERIEVDSQNSIGDIKNHVDEIVARNSDTAVNANTQLNNSEKVKDAVERYAQSAPDDNWGGYRNKAMTRLQNILNELGESPTVKEIMHMKSVLQKKGKDAIGQGPDVDASKAFSRDLAVVFKDMAYDAIGGTDGQKVKRLNMISSDLQEQLTGIRERVGAHLAGGGKGAADAARYGTYNPKLGAVAASQAMTSMTGPRLMKASAQEFIDESIPGVVKDAVQTVPYRAERKIRDAYGRKSQSIEREIINTPLSRSSEGIINDRDFAIAKIGLEAPQLLDGLKQVLDRSPEDVADLLPALAKAAPQLFERDKYNRTDGVILDPIDADRARKDVMNDDSLSTLAKADIINKLNRTGEFNYGS